jgi:hypothetical protein
MENHLVIGLGGTGGKIIRSLRKSIYQEFRTLEPETAKIRFLYVDSSKEIMGLDDPTWRTLGRSVQLDKRSQLLITGSDLNQILNNLDNFPQIRPWIGDRAQWRDILNSIVGETLGGQKRRLGRFLFACKASDFTAQLRHLASELPGEDRGALIALLGSAERALYLASAGSAQRAKTARAFLEWSVTSGRTTAEQLGYVALPSSVVEKVQAVLR